MDRKLLVWLLPLLLGVVLLATVPPDSQYIVEAYEPHSEPDDEEITPYEDLSAENQAWFDEAREGTIRFPTTSERSPPDFGRLYVAYEDDVYVLEQGVLEGHGMAIVQPMIGGLAILVGCLGVLYHYRSRLADWLLVVLRYRYRT